MALKYVKFAVTIASIHTIENHIEIIHIKMYIVFLSEKHTALHYCMKSYMHMMEDDQRLNVSASVRIISVLFVSALH